MAKILRGDIVAQKIISDLEPEIQDLKAKNIKPVLAIILIGDDPASKIYVNQKQSRVEALGFSFNLYEFLPIATEVQIIELIEKLDQAEHVDGILVQLPLPHSFKKEKILGKINLKKDIDALNKNSKYKSPTAQAILEILKFYKIPIKQKKMVIVGKGILVGKPLAKLAKGAGANVTICDNKTKNLKMIIKKAEILVAGVGKENLIKDNMVSRDCVVVDAGTQVVNGSQVGDVDFGNVARKVKAITPPKGGVGPVTVACLIRNLIISAKNRERS